MISCRQHPGRVARTAQHSCNNKLAANVSIRAKHTSNASKQQQQCRAPLPAARPLSTSTSSSSSTTVCAAGGIVHTQNGATVRHGALVARPGARFAVVVGRFNDLVTKLLLDGALGAFAAHGVDMKNVEVCWVPGSFELPVAGKAMAKSGKFDAVVCIGVVVRGATTHYDAVVSAATSGVLNAGVDTGVPTVFGVLTCDTMEQALDRAGGKVGNKGGEAAVTAIEMANLLGDLRAEGLAAPAWV